MELHFHLHMKRPAACCISCALIIACAVFAAPVPLRADDAADQYDFANGLFARKMYAMAGNEYAKFISAYPDRKELARAYFMRAEALFYQGEYATAIAAYDEYLARFPKDADVTHARLRIIASAIETKDCPRALSEAAGFAEASQPPETRGEALYLIGLARLSCGDRDAAVKSFEAAVSLGDTSSYAAVAAYQLGRMRAANADHAGAVPLFDKAVALAADDETKVLAAIGAAGSRIELGRFKEAAEILGPIALGPLPMSDTKDLAILGLVRSFYGMKEYAAVIEARKSARESVRSSSTRMQTALFAAQAYTRLGKADDAIALLDLILADTGLTAAERETAVFAQVQALMAGKRYADARALLDARADYSDPARAAFLKAETSYYLKTFAEARKEYDAFILSYPDSPLKSQALYGLAFAALNNGEKPVARDVFLKVVDGDPDPDTAAKALSYVVLLDRDLGLHEEGVAHAKSFLEQYGGRDEAKAVLFALGRMYADLKRPADAIRTYEDYIAQYPGDGRIPEAFFLIGRNYQTLGDTARSTGSFEKVSKEAPGNPDLYYAARQNIAQNYIAEKRELDAARVTEEILVQYPKENRSFDTWLWVIKRYIDARLYDDALRVIGLAAKDPAAGPYATALLYYTSDIDRARGNVDAALAGFEKCVRVEEGADGRPSYTGAAQVGIGLCRMAQSDNDAARTAFEDAIAADPSDNTTVMRARYYLADLLAAAGNDAEAATAYMMVAILYDDPTFVPQALYKAILAFEKLGKKDELEKACRDFLKRFPEDEHAAHARKVLAHSGSPDR